MKLVYYTKSKQEQMAVFAWLIRRGYIEKHSNITNTWIKHLLPIHYDFIHVDVDLNEFSFFTGKFSNVAGVAVTTSHNVSVLFKKIESAEFVKSAFSYTVSTTLSP